MVNERHFEIALTLAGAKIRVLVAQLQEYPSYAPLPELEKLLQEILEALGPEALG
jgi:hypothetical protein